MFKETVFYQKSGTEDVATHRIDESGRIYSKTRYGDKEVGRINNYGEIETKTGSWLFGSYSPSNITIEEGKINQKTGLFGYGREELGRIDEKGNVYIGKGKNAFNIGKLK